MNFRSGPERYVLAGAMILVLAAAGCRKDGAGAPNTKGGPGAVSPAGNPADNNALPGEVAARVGKMEVTLNDLRGEAKGKEYDVSKSGSPEMSALRALDRLVTYRLLYQDAVEKKTFENSPLERELRTSREIWLGSLYVNDVLPRQVAVKEDELAPLLLAKWDTVDISMLVSGEAETLRAAVESIRKGETTFEAEAAKGSETLAKKKGHVGWILRDTSYFTDKALVEKIFSLKAGEMTEPFQGPLGWTVVRVNDRRMLTAAEIESYKKPKREFLYNRKFQDLLTKAAAAVSWKQFPENLASKSKDAVVLSGGGRTYTKADFETFAMIHFRSGHMGVTKETGQQVLENFASHMSWAEEARRIKYDKRPDFNAKMESYRIARTGEAVEESLRKSLDPGREALRAFYNKDKDRFREEDSLWMLALVADTQQRASGYRKRALAGEDFASLIREAGEKLGEKVSTEEAGPVTRKMFPPDMNAILFALRDGDISTVFPLSGKFVVVKCTRFVKGKARPFEKIEKEVLEAYRNDNYLPLLEKRVQELKVRYPVVMNESAVRVVAKEIMEEAQKRGNMPRYH